MTVSYSEYEMGFHADPNLNDILESMGLVPEPYSILQFTENGQWVYKKYRERLETGRIYYLSPSGDDSNDGSQAHPWKSIQFALDWVDHNLEQAGFSVVLQLADGIYDERIYTIPDTKRITIKGNTSNNKAVRLRSSADQTNYIFTVRENSSLTVQSLYFESVNNNAGILVSDGSHLLVLDCVIGTFVSTSVYAVDGGSLIDFRGIKVAANNKSINCFLSGYGAQIRFYNSIAFESGVDNTHVFYALRLGMINIYGDITGSPSGRATASTGSFIEGKTKLPASITENVGTGGQII